LTLHVHLENLSAKPPIFWLTPGLLESSLRGHEDLLAHCRFTVGNDFENLAANLATATVLVTSVDVICDSRFTRDELVRRAPALRHIHLIGAAVDRVLPLAWLPERVELTNNSGVHVDKAREYLTMALLALNARLPAMAANQRNSLWSPVFTPLACGKTVLVVGLGDMGQAAVGAAHLLGMKVIGVSRSGAAVEGVDRVYPVKELPSVIGEADFVVLAMPLTPASRNMFDPDLLSRIKPGAGLVNVGRAGVMDHDGLQDSLRTGRLSGAILDVLPEEPLPSSSALWNAGNLMITPHVSADDLDGYMPGTMQLVFRNLRRRLAGEPLVNVVDRDAGY
jgi:phosphoglycerate dehydrogenase-like enzyme